MNRTSNRTTTALTLTACAATALALTGCGSSPSTAAYSSGCSSSNGGGTMCSTVNVVSMGAMADYPASPDFFVLGAGDNLGQEVFAYYVASLNLPDHDAQPEIAETRFATGSVDFPE